MILRFLFFILVALLALNAPLSFAILTFVVYAFFFTPYELIVLALCIDALYGTGMGSSLIPKYTLCVLGIAVLLLWIKPRLSVYNQ
jgi:hypothetical protein